MAKQGISFIQYKVSEWKMESLGKPHEIGNDRRCWKY